jgi:hypothetical protein
MNTKRPRRKQPQDHTTRLLAILESNLKRATSADLRKRLKAAIASLKEKAAA